MALNQSINQLNGIGPKTLEKFSQLGLYTWRDLLWHLPLRYENRSQYIPCARLTHQTSQLFRGRILSTVIKKDKKPLLTVDIADDSGRLQLLFLHQISFHHQRLRAGLFLSGFGKISRMGRLCSTIHPEYQVHPHFPPPPHLQNYYAIYPLTEGLTQKTRHRCMQQILETLSKHPLPEYLSDELRTQWQLPTLTQALQHLHQPPLEWRAHTLEQSLFHAKARLALDEALGFKTQQQPLFTQTHTAPVCPPDHALDQRFLALLPFTLTNEQQQAHTSIEQDLNAPKPMIRLLQGDVGTGKTVVATRALLQVIANGYQAAFLAPTALLAQQHANTLTPWMEALGIHLELLMGNTKDKSLCYGRLQSGETPLIIGTHALLEDKVQFANLGLVVLDEQHRFGVHQRQQLTEKSPLAPHVLSMTATPIPRTLALLQYGQFQHTRLTRKPHHHNEIITRILPNDPLESLLTRLQAWCDNGKQAYWVCPLIEENPELNLQAAKARFEKLCEALPSIRIGLLHGRLHEKEKQARMEAFLSQKIQLLVCTTVIEVGIDIHNANLMIIEHSERFGLSQLHQLRGRVGRGQENGYCILLYSPPIGEKSQQRLRAMQDHQDGFLLAELDLAIRGPGESLGLRQSGFSDFQCLNSETQTLISPWLEILIQEKMISPKDWKYIAQRWSRKHHQTLAV